MKVKKKIIKIVLIQLLFLITSNVICLFYKNELYFRQLSFVATISLIGIGLFIILSIYVNFNIFSIGGLFIFLSYIFHFGQVYTNVFSPGYKTTSTNFLLINQDINIKALLFAFNIIIIVSTFILLSNASDKYIDLDNIKIALNTNNMKTLAWVIFIITIPFEVLYFYKILSASKSGLNYSSIYSIDISGWQFQMGALSVLAFVLLICSYSDKKTISTLITAMGCFFYGISMISGSRIYAVVSICIIIYTYVNYIQKITFGRLILYIIGGSIFATILHAIMRLRTRGALTIPEIINFVFSSENNVLVGLLDEFGGTIYTVTIAIKEIPQNIQYNYGKSYLYSLATIGLNIGGVLNYVIKNVEYTLSFQTKYTFGGSYIGELYYNFGLFSYLVAPIIGAFIGILSKSMNYYAEKRDGYKYCYFVMAMYSCLIWVRSYCDVLTRNIAWGAILLYVVSYLINYKSRIRE